jgi:alanyl-tRNA synthetase
MNSQKLRENFLNFFEKKDHKILPTSPLIDKEDPSVLLTSAGMQQFKAFFAGKKNAQSKLGKDKIATIQKCFRTSDIEVIGDRDHLTFLEMLGNFSFHGVYWKKEALQLAVDFLTEKLNFKKTDFRITVFKGDKNIPFDKETYDIWLKLGFKEEQISKANREDNFWGPTGEEGPCGPATEIYLQDSEIWNIVFNQYYADKKGQLVPLAHKGIDTGMGLERLAMVSQGKKTVFETDLFRPLIQDLRKADYVLNKENRKEERIVIDHMRGIVFLIAEGLIPSNVKEGYILRRILRRMLRSAKKLALGKEWYQTLVDQVISVYGSFYTDLKKERNNILTVIQKEEKTFQIALKKGINRLNHLLKQQDDKKVFPGEEAFKLYESYGFPYELTEELLQERGYKLEKEGFEKARRKHQQISRQSIVKKIGGLREDPVYQEIKLHTATHLLHQALHDVLGNKAKQMGSDINEERLRFDFSFHRSLTDEELQNIEDIVNQKIKQDLRIKRIETSLSKALEMGALALFKHKYPKKVSVYKIYPKGDKNNPYSCEICKGPHVSHTSELKNFKILKQKSVGAGVKRIRAKIS